jgi:hypothetical protein
MVSTAAFVEADFHSAMPRRSDGLQTSSLAPDARCGCAATPAHDSGTRRTRAESVASSTPILTIRRVARSGGTGGRTGQGVGGGCAVRPGTRLTYRWKFSGAGGRKRKWPQLFNGLRPPCFPRLAHAGVDFVLARTYRPYQRAPLI